MCHCAITATTTIVGSSRTLNTGATRFFFNFFFIFIFYFTELKNKSKKQTKQKHWLLEDNVGKAIKINRYIKRTEQKQNKLHKSIPTVQKYPKLYYYLAFRQNCLFFFQKAQLNDVLKCPPGGSVSLCRRLSECAVSEDLRAEEGYREDSPFITCVKLPSL